MRSVGKVLEEVDVWITTSEDVSSRCFTLPECHYFRVALLHHLLQELLFPLLLRLLQLLQSLLGCHLHDA